MLELERILKAGESKISLEKARFLAEKIYKLTMSTRMTANINQYSCTPVKSLKSPNYLTSSQQTTEMAVPLRRTENAILGSAFIHRNLFQE